MPVSILFLLYHCNAESENSWLHIIIWKKYFLFLNTRNVYAMRGALRVEGCTSSLKPEKGELDKSRVIALTLPCHWSQHWSGYTTLLKSSSGVKRKQFSSSAATDQVWVNLFWWKTLNLGEFYVVTLWCRLLSMRGCVENNKCIVYRIIES